MQSVLAEVRESQSHAAASPVVTPERVVEWVNTARPSLAATSRPFAEPDTTTSRRVLGLDTDTLPGRSVATPVSATRSTRQPTPPQAQAATVGQRTATTRTEVLDLHTVYFLSGSATPGPEGRRLLARAAQVLIAHQALRLELGGHADSTGSRALNLRLSEQRASAVRAFLVRSGCSADRLVVVGRGPDQPAATNTTRGGRALNRRVTLLPLD